MPFGVEQAYFVGAASPCFRLLLAVCDSQSQASFSTRHHVLTVTSFCDVLQKGETGEHVTFWVLFAGSLYYVHVMLSLLANPFVSIC